jgi:hypothetical protein
MSRVGLGAPFIGVVSRMAGWAKPKAKDAEPHYPFSIRVVTSCVFSSISGQSKLTAQPLSDSKCAGGLGFFSIGPGQSRGIRPHGDGSVVISTTEPPKTVAVKLRDAGQGPPN